MYARVVQDRNQEHDYRLYAREQRFEIKDTNDRLLVQPIEGYDVNEAVRQVNHIARWAQIRAMESPKRSYLTTQLRLKFLRMVFQLKGTDLRLEYKYNNGDWQPPVINLKLKNTQERSFYCALLDIADDYSVSIPGVLPEGGDYSWICLDKNKSIKHKFSIMKTLPQKT